MEKGKTYKLKHKENGSTHNVTVTFGKDGHVHFCGEDAWHEQIYLYPRQARRLVRVIRQREGV